MGFLIGVVLLAAIGFGHFDVEGIKIAFLLVAPFAFIASGVPAVVFLGVDMLVFLVSLFIKNDVGLRIMIISFTIFILGVPCWILYLIFR